MKQRVVRYGFIVNLFLLALSGFAQMPIFKRYYIADIPGLGWLAEFYLTHYLHYLAAVLFFGLLAYIVAEHALNGPARQRRLSLSGAVRCLILTAVIVSGIFLVVRNMSGYLFSPGFIIFLDIGHLGAVMLYLAVALYCAATRKDWTSGLQRHMNKG